ncbi:hypothetical protein O0L34_g1276 [Tuta absoluta]|nr:hypothetical protein O0L34_g1276 [Tuta absoluta]
MFLVYALVILSFSLTALNQVANNKNFGPYELVWKRFELCKGPKQHDCGKVHLENTEDMSDVIFVLDFPKDCPVTKAKVTIGSKQTNNSTKKLWNYSLDHPCQHFVLGPILLESFNLTNTCKVNKVK